LFTEFHGLSENPFTIMPSPRLAWLGAGMRKVRTELCEAVLEGQGLVVISGGPGVGKSLALILLASDLEQSGVPCRIHALNCGVGASARQGTPTAEGRTPEAMGSAELAQLLARARHQIKSFALMAPPGDNALETLQRVLAVLPGQPDALRGIHDIGSRYALLAVWIATLVEKLQREGQP
jgi:hypothetical protein